MFDFLKYQIIGFLTPEERLYNANLQARKDAEWRYSRTRNDSVLRVWYLDQLREWDFFAKSWEYTGIRWKEDDLFNFEKYRYGENETLFFDTAYKIIYGQLLDKLGKEKLSEFKINKGIKRNKHGQMKADDTLYEFHSWFEDGFAIQEIVDCIVKFKDFNYKKYKKSSIMRDKLIGNNLPIKDYEKNYDSWNIDKRRKRFQEEYLNPLYEAFDEQVKITQELKNNPLAKQIYEQNKILKQQAGIKEEEPIFDFRKKKKKNE